MKKTQKISNFLHSQYFANGLRITLGCIIPILVCAALDKMLLGTYISFGALLIGLSDTPGAPSHRRTGMVACLVLCVFTQLLTVLVHEYTWLMTIVIAVVCFILSMFAVFNDRAATVGSMGILIMLLHVDNDYGLNEGLMSSFYFVIGALWYMLISFSMTQARPYRLAQQELSEAVHHVGEFIRLRGNLYRNRVDIDKTYTQLIDKQIEVHQHQEQVRDLLFQSKRNIKDTTTIGRYLTLMFNDIVDLYEESLATHYDHELIRKEFGDTGILLDFRLLLVKIAGELDHLAVQLNANRLPRPLYNFTNDFEKTLAKIEELPADKKNKFTLKKILISIRKITDLLYKIYNYSPIQSSNIDKQEIENARKFIQTEHIDLRKLKDNLSLNSSVFRHALRVAIVISATFLILNLGFVDVGNMGSYWILLTIMVILKPGFALTKERNFQRLLGTVIGGIIGAIILITIQSEIIRFGLLVFFFLIAYSLFRVNYIMAVMFMTPYVLIMLSFSGVNTFEVAKERIFDTILGGMIAFLSSYIIFPNWESFQIRNTMRKLLIADYNYLTQAVRLLAGEPISVTDYKLTRKEVYIASANMGSTFQRLLSEPKWRQKSSKEVNRFVILNYILTSYGATLLIRLHEAANPNYIKEHLTLLKGILNNINNAIQAIPKDDVEEPECAQINQFPELTSDTLDPEETDLITEQLQFLKKISSDLQKATVDVVEKESALLPQKLETADG